MSQVKNSAWINKASKVEVLTFLKGTADVQILQTWFDLSHFKKVARKIVKNINIYGHFCIRNPEKCYKENFKNFGIVKTERKLRTYNHSIFEAVDRLCNRTVRFKNRTSVQ